MSVIVVDASVWVSRLAPADAFHQPVKAWMDQQQAEESQLVAPSLLLAEVAGAISRRTGAVDLALEAIEDLQSLPGVRLVEMDSLLARRAAQLAASLGLRGADSFYVALAAELKIPLATLDRDQMERAAPLISIQSIE